MPTLTHFDFEPLLQGTFSVYYNEAEFLPVTLTEIKFWGKDNNPADRSVFQPFALIFQSQITDYLPQATYRITHPDIGEHDIFIVPIGLHTGGMRYEATFG